jgi:choline dehydrogenase-like flavoprotein
MKQGYATSEAIVIGSGFGGAVAACRLAQAGFSVTILERGRRYASKDIPNLPQDRSFLPDERRWSWNLDQGLWEVLDLDEIISVQAAGYGGGSLVYANVHLRPPRSAFGEDWPAVHRDRHGLDDYFDLVASMLEVAPVSQYPDFHKQITKSHQLRKAGESLGTRVFHPPLAIRYENDGLNAHGVFQRRCTGCGACCTGCPQGAKNTLDHNYLAVAERHGTRVLTQFEVSRLVERRDGTWMVDGFDHLEARRVSLHCRYVFLCAGSVHSTEILKRSDLRPIHRSTDKGECKVKSPIGLGYFPGGDALAIAYDTKHPQEPSVGPVISTALVEWSRDKSFFMVQDGGYPARVSRHVGLLRAASWLHLNRLRRKANTSLQASPARTDPQFGEPLERFAESRAPSCPDQILMARADGAFDTVVPHQLKGFRRRLANRLSSPLLLREAVAHAVVKSLRSRWKCLGPFRAAFVSVISWLSRKLLGHYRLVGARALRTMLRGGGLARDEFAARVAGIRDGKRAHRAVLLAMGRDPAEGVLHYDRKRRRMVADLNLKRLAPGHARQEGLLVRIAEKLGGELRNNPMWEFLHKPITVHNQGGCRMSDDPDRGVTDAFGKVHHRRGLHILDGSILCNSVGVNPSATIAAIAERGVLEFIRSHRPSFPDDSPGGKEYRIQRARAVKWADDAKANGWDLEPPEATPDATPLADPVGLVFRESMCGYYSIGGEVPRDGARHLELETLGRPDWPIEVKLRMCVPDFKAFMEDPKHTITCSGTVEIRLPGSQFGPYEIEAGRAELFVPVSKDHALSDGPRELQDSIARWGYETVPCDDPSLPERLMHYVLFFKDESQRRWVLRGRKRIAATSSVDAWRHTSILHVKLEELPAGLPQEPPPDLDADEPHGELRGAGAVHVDLMHFLYKQLPSVEATGTDDRNRQARAVAAFCTFFFGTLQRIYLPALRDAARDTIAAPRLEKLHS